MSLFCSMLLSLGFIFIKQRTKDRYILYYYGISVIPFF